MQTLADARITPGDASFRDDQHATNAAGSFATAKKLTQLGIANAVHDLPSEPPAHKELFGHHPSAHFGAPLSQNSINGDWDEV